MDVKDLCLGALTFGDASGYDIKKFFQQSFSHFYVAGYGSIYPALAKLTASGLVRCQIQTRAAGPERKLYSLTPRGKRAFQARLAKTKPRHQVKFEFLVLMYFAHLLKPRQLREILDSQMADFDRYLQQLRVHETSDDSGNMSTAGARFVCGYGKTVLGAARSYLRKQRRSLVRDTWEAPSKIKTMNHRGKQRPPCVTTS